MSLRTAVLVGGLALGLVVVPALMEGCIERPKVGPVGSDAADLPSAKETEGADGGAELLRSDSLPEVPDVPCADECGCAPECGAKECGGDGCGGSCGQCPDQHICDPDTGTCIYSKDCGNGSCDGGEDCLSCPLDCKCGGGQECDEGQCIECPEYCGKYGKQCGEFQGCGCGTCGQQTTCIDGQCVCEPDCEGKECGQDGCGGSCGSCPPGQTCSGSECVEGPCTNECNFAGEKECAEGGYRECGAGFDDDECLEWSGVTACLAGHVCEGGECVCVPECAGKECGDDGCGASCGSCEDGATCVGVTCVFSECDDGNDVDWDGCTNGQITEFQVNATSAASQWDPSVATFGDGGFVVVWESGGGQDGSESGVFGQRFDPDGKPAGGEFQVNSYTAGSQEEPCVAAFADGRFVVVWTSEDGQDGSEEGVFGRRYDANGNPAGGAFQVNSFTDDGQFEPSVATTSGNRFVVVWKSYQQEDWDPPYDAGYGVFGQLYSSDGSKVGGEFLVNTEVEEFQKEPCAAGFGDGRFVIVWDSFKQDGSSYGVFGQRYKADGQTKDGNEFMINTFTDENQGTPAVAAFSNGFIVVWDSDEQDGSSFGTFGQRYSAGGVKLGLEFPVNSYTTDNQWQPGVAAFSDGRFVVAWESYGQDGGKDGVFGQRFDTNGNKSGAEFQINTFSAGDQGLPSVATFDGGFVVVWTSDGQDGASDGIFAQRYDENGDKLY